MAKSNKAAVVFAVGARVAASLPSISGEPLVGTIEVVTGKGWYRVKLDTDLDTIGVKDGCVSALARSLVAYVEPVEPDEKAEASDDDRDDQGPEGEPSDPEGGEPEEVEATGAAKMAEALKKAREHYVKCKRPNGAATAHNGDGIATALRDYEPKEVAALADRCLDLPLGTHELKYGHLNNGQIRMNSGNRIRATFLKAVKEQDSETIKRISKILDLDTPDEEADEEQNDE